MLRWFWLLIIGCSEETGALKTTNVREILRFEMNFILLRAGTKLIKIGVKWRKLSWRRHTPRELKRRHKSERSVEEPRRKGFFKRRIPKNSANGKRKNNVGWRRSALLEWNNSRWKLYDRSQWRLASVMRIWESHEFVIIIEIFERKLHEHIGKIYFVQFICEIKKSNLNPSSNSLTSPILARSIELIEESTNDCVNKNILRLVIYCIMYTLFALLPAYILKYHRYFVLEMSNVIN